ncbi:MAG TPA: hypothetical protein VMJ73_05740 [Rhizomicrobium sp.]|nr:hypothetical protein [Rhizomicrobium sp.]
MQLTDLGPYLMAGEHMVWSGEPRRGIILTASDIFLIPFSLLWGGFAIFWEASVVTSHAPIFFELWGVPFVGAGLYIIVGRFFVDAWTRKQTAYLLTDRRILLVRSGPLASTTSLQLRTLTNVQLKEASAGRGTIIFGDMIPYRWAVPRGWPGMPNAPMFFQIEDAHSVYGKIQSLQERQSGG